jgi:uncharacterized protein YjbI with pentapeptide repeats
MTEVKRPLPPDVLAALGTYSAETFGKVTSFDGRDLRGCDFDGVSAFEPSWHNGAVMWFLAYQLGFAGADLAGATFRGARLDGWYFSHATLERAVFDGARLRKTDFYGARLAGASFAGATLTKNTFMQADLTSADFTGASVRACSFDEARLGGASLRDTILHGVSFTGADVAGLDVTGARFNDVWLGGATDLNAMHAEWIIVGDERFQEHLEGERARRGLRAAAQFETSAAFRWDEAGIGWRCEPELVPSGQRELERLLARRAEAPFAGVRLSRAAIEWLIARRGEETPVALDLRGADLSQLYLWGLPLRGLVAGLRAEAWDAATPEERERLAAHLEGSEVSDLAGAVLGGAHLEGAHLIGTLDGADVSHAHLSGAQIKPSSARGARFDGASADGINAFMLREDLGGSSWRGASLVGARFFNAKLIGADFRDATLTGANFHDAKLDGADFTGADLTGADFTRASTEGTIFPQ